jgi:hypothetical protein
LLFSNLSGLTRAFPSVFVLTEALWDKFSVKAVRMNEDDDDDDEEEEDAQGKTANAQFYFLTGGWYKLFNLKMSCWCFHLLFKFHLTLLKMMTTMNEPYDNCV